MDSPLLFPNSLPVFLKCSTYAGYSRMASKVFYFVEGESFPVSQFFSDSTVLGLGLFITSGVNMLNFTTA